MSTVSNSSATPPLVYSADTYSSSTTSIIPSSSTVNYYPASLSLITSGTLTYTPTSSSGSISKTVPNYLPAVQLCFSSPTTSTISTSTPVITILSSMTSGYVPTAFFSTVYFELANDLDPQNYLSYSIYLVFQSSGASATVPYYVQAFLTSDSSKQASPILSKLTFGSNGYFYVNLSLLFPSYIIKANKIYKVECNVYSGLAAIYNSSTPSASSVNGSLAQYYSSQTMYFLSIPLHPFFSHESITTLTTSGSSAGSITTTPTTPYLQCLYSNTLSVLSIYQFQNTLAGSGYYPNSGLTDTQSAPAVFSFSALQETTTTFSFEAGMVFMMNQMLNPNDSSAQAITLNISNLLTSSTNVSAGKNNYLFYYCVLTCTIQKRVYVSPVLRVSTIFGTQTIASDGITGTISEYPVSLETIIVSDFFPQLLTSPSLLCTLKIVGYMDMVAFNSEQSGYTLNTISTLPITYMSLVQGKLSTTSTNSANTLWEVTKSSISGNAFYFSSLAFGTGSGAYNPTVSSLSNTYSSSNQTNTQGFQVNISGTSSFTSASTKSYSNSLAENCMSFIQGYAQNPILNLSSGNLNALLNIRHMTQRMNMVSSTNYINTSINFGNSSALGYPPSTNLPTMANIHVIFEVQAPLNDVTDTNDIIMSIRGLGYGNPANWSYMVSGTIQSDGNSVSCSQNFTYQVGSGNEPGMLYTMFPLAVQNSSYISNIQTYPPSDTNISYPVVNNMGSSYLYGPYIVDNILPMPFPFFANNKYSPAVSIGATSNTAGTSELAGTISTSGTNAISTTSVECPMAIRWIGYLNITSAYQWFGMYCKSVDDLMMISIYNSTNASTKATCLANWYFYINGSTTSQFQSWFYQFASPGLYPIVITYTNNSVGPGNIVGLVMGYFSDPTTSILYTSNYLSPAFYSLNNQDTLYENPSFPGMAMLSNSVYKYQSNQSSTPSTSFLYDTTVYSNGSVTDSSTPNQLWNPFPSYVVAPTINLNITNLFPQNSFVPGKTYSLDINLSATTPPL